MFLSVWLFPWKLGKGIIVFRTQTETDQIHRQPRDQNRSCGSGTHHALIRFGLVAGLVCVQTETSASVCHCPLPSCLPKRGKIWERKLERKAVGCYTVHPPLGGQGQLTVTQALVGLVNWEDTSCVDFSILQHVIWPGVPLFPSPFLPAPSAETSRVIPSWSALLLPLFLALPQKSILSFMSRPFMHKGTVVACCGAVPLHFHQWGFLSFSSKYDNGALKAWMPNAECTILQSPLILFCQSQ